MKRTKRAIVIITSIIVVMLIIPLITVNTSILYAVLETEEQQLLHTLRN